MAFLILIIYISLCLACIDLNGSNRRTIVELESGSKPYGITMAKNNIFWTDWRE